jgi:hypothetical protein
MRTVAELGLKITAAQREYCRYTGLSAEVERQGAGSSRPELAWIHRLRNVQKPSCSTARVTTESRKSVNS